MQVWSRHGGYPGDGAYLEFHKIRWPGGLKFWRVTGPDVDLGHKAPYEPAMAAQHARGACGHFARLLAMHLAAEQPKRGPAVLVAPFDTELFGHWWFEGPDFLEETYRALPRAARGASEHRVGAPAGPPADRRPAPARGLLGRQRRLQHVAQQ